MTAAPDPRVEDIYALSPVQQGMFFHSLLEPELAPYVQQSLWNVDGALDISIFERSWNRLVEQQPILRTVFRQTRKQPVQIVLRQLPVRIAVHDLTAQAASEQEAAVQRHLHEDLACPIDIARGPLFRLSVFRMSADRFKFLWTAHHIIMDGFTAGALLWQLATTYEALCADQAPPVPDTLPFKDFILWLSRQESEAALDYWQRHLGDFAAPTALPLDRQKLTISGRRHAVVSVTFAQDLGRRLTELARKGRVTRTAVMQAAWAILLGRYSGAHDVVFGLTVAGRPPALPGVERILGPFINTLPIRVSTADDPRVWDVIRSIKQQTLHLNRHSYVSLADVQARTGVRPPGRLFESLFNSFSPTYSTALRCGDVVLTPARQDLSAGRTNYDLVLDVLDVQPPQISISYVEDVLDSSTATAMLRHLQGVCESMVSAPEGRCSDLVLISKEEQAAVAALGTTGGAIAAAPWRGLPIAEHARRQPDARAVVSGDGVLGYGELNARANRLAHYLRGIGVGREDRVGVLGRRGSGMLSSVLGVIRSGAAFVPLDGGEPRERLRGIVGAAGLRCLLVGADGVELGLELASPSGVPVVSWDEVSREGVAGAREWSSCRDEEPGREGWTGRDLACVFYTSGSTGRPKGVMVERAGMLNHLRAKVELLGLGRTDAVVQNASHCFDIWVWQSLSALLAGGRVLIYEDAVSLAPERLLEAVARDGATVLETVPSFLELLVGIDGAGERLRGLRYLVSNAETLSVWLSRRWFEVCGGVKLLNTWGSTECSDDVTHEVMERGPEEGSPRVGVGRPIGGAQVYVLDGDLRIVPVGCVGEIAVGGVCVGRGYLGEAGATASSYIPDPFGEEGGRLYRTGDLGRWRRDGVLEFLGRRDGQVKVRGHRVEIGEVEGALASHPGVSQGVVEAKGGRLVGYWVGPEEISAADLRSHLGRRLPGFMVPEAFVRLGGLPLTRTGKVDRHALPEPEGQGSVEYVAPRTGLEQEIAAVWRDVLGVARVGVHDNFFDLGGHSLKTTQVRSRISHRLGIDVPLKVVFDHQRLDALARAIAPLVEARTAEVDVRIPRLPDKEHYRLSHAQRRLWFLQHLKPDGRQYNTADAVVIEGTFDRAAFDRALQALVGRQAALRTSFAVVDGEPVQRLHEGFGIPMSVHDLSNLSRKDQERQTRRLARALGREPFALDIPPVRGLLLKLAEQRHLLYLALHHIVSDAWSGPVLSRDLLQLYAAERDHVAPDLPDLRVRYVDFAEWQGQRLAGEALGEQLSYWRERLAGVPDRIELPLDHPRTAVPQEASGEHVFSLAGGLGPGLEALSRAEGCTLFMTLLSAFVVLLSRHSGQTDLVVGTPAANRLHRDVEDLIGCFVNTLALRTDLSGDPTARDVLGRVRDACLGAYANQEAPFEHVVRAASPTRTPSHLPVVQVMFTLHPSPAGATGALASEPGMAGADGTAALDLVLTVSGSGQDLVGVFSYRKQLFEPPTVRRLAERYVRLLEGIVRDPEVPISKLPLLSEDERRTVTVEWNQTKREYGGAGTVVAAFEAQVRRAPGAVAVVSGPRRLTYGELNGRAEEVARALSALGVGIESRVGLCVERSLETAVGALGILKSGAAYVALDPALPVARLTHMLKDAEAAVLLTTSSLCGERSEVARHVLCLDQELPKGEALGRSSAGVANAAYVIYTSGSTGEPKGVEVSHESLMNLVEWHRETYRLGKADRGTLLAGPGFDAAVWELWPYLACGARVCVVDDETRGAPSALIEQLSREEITVSFLPTPLAEEVLKREELAETSLRVLLTGGDRLHRHRPAGHRYRLVNHYGPTEATVVATSSVVEVEVDGGLPPIGRPIGNVRVYVLDEESEPVPVGVAGELYIGGTGLARGYVNRPDLTAERFVPDGLSGEKGARLYRTGDRVRQHVDGQLEFIGRLDEQMKLRGYRIEPGEIEAALLSEDGVREALVLAKESPGNTGRLIAYLGVGATELNLAALRARLQERLPHYMVPSAFVLLPALPKTPSGKIDRHQLPESADAPRAPRTRPRTAIEKQIAEVFGELLGLEEVDIHDSFFDLGGDSVQSIQAVSRLRDRGLHVTAKAFYKHQTVAALAEVTEERYPLPAAVLASDSVTLSPPQAFFFEQDWGQAHHWNTAVLLKAPRLAVRPLRRALQTLLDHHDALRARFARGELGWRQQDRAPGEAVRLEVVNLRRLNLERLDAEAARVQRSLDLAQGPLFRAALFRCGAAGDRLLVVVHHLVSDGVSMRILLEDLLAAYEQAVRGRAIRLPPRTTAYAQWARMLERQAPELATAELPYWCSVLDQGVTRLPQDHDRGPNDHDSLATREVALEPAGTQALLGPAKQVHGAEINGLLLTALGRAFGDWTQARELVLTLVGHGREESLLEQDLTRTVGFFTSFHPIRVETGASRAADVARVGRELRGIPNRGVGYGVLRYVARCPELRRPLPEVSFNYLGRYDLLRREGAFSLSNESAGSTLGLRGERIALLDVVCFIAGDRLWATFRYSRNRHQASTIDRLAARFLHELRALAAVTRERAAYSGRAHAPTRGYQE